jgi:hypothetical protein
MSDCGYNSNNPPNNCINTNSLQDISNVPKTYDFKDNLNANIQIFAKPSKSHNQGLADMTESIPESWNWLNQDTEGIINDGYYDQGECGSCWAFSVAMVLSDLYAIKYKILSPNLSPLWLVTCANNSTASIQYDSPTPIKFSNFPPDNTKACCGGNNFIGAKWLEDNKKIGTIDCWPITQSIDNELYHDSQTTNTCLDVVKNNIGCYLCENNNDKLKATDFGVKKGSAQYLVSHSGTNINIPETISNIKRQIMLGPVMTNMRVPSDFINWWNNNSKDDIYQNSLDLSSGNTIGNHAVSLIGWGNDNGVDYWIMRNSWGKTHDTLGICKIAMTTENTDPNYYIGLDIPIVADNSPDPIGWLGGAISMEADNLPESWKNTKKIKLKTKPTGPGAMFISKDDNIVSIFKNHWQLIVVFILVIIILLIIIT